MANTIIQLRHSTVEGNVPLSLANGEISINTRDGKLYYAQPDGTVTEFSGFTGPSGLNGEIQFNDAGSLGADAGLTYNKTTDVLTVVGGAIIGGTNVAPQIQFAYDHANAAFAQANTGGGGSVDVYARDTANAAFIHANAAFAQANTGGGGGSVDVYARDTANAAFIQANTPSHVANSAAIYANGAFAAANAATTTNITQNNSITAAFIRANNSLNANVGGTITGNVIVVGNLTSDTISTTGSNGSISGANAIFSNYVFAANGTVDLFIYANNAYTAANGAFAAANAATATDTTQNNSIAAAFVHANAAFIQANTPSDVANSAAIYANGAFAAANAATATDETQNNSITVALNTSNAVFIRANNSLDANNGGIVTGNVTVTQNLIVLRDATISGNLVVLGNTFSINASTLVANDTLLVLGTGNYIADILDIGFAGHYNDGTNAHTGLIRDAGTKEWHLFKGYVPEISANNNVNINDPTFLIDTLNANLDATTVLIKNIDILPYVNTAFNTANAAFIQANTPSHVANSAAIYANGAFAAANAATATDATQNNSITAAFIHANSAFIASNGAAIAANTPSHVANSAAIYANGAFASANVATATNITQNNSIIASFAHANAAFNVANSGITFTSSATPPSSPNAGDQWYRTGTDILYEYINDGTSLYWVDITSSAVATQATTVTITGGDALNPFLLAGM